MSLIKKMEGKKVGLLLPPHDAQPDINLKLLDQATIVTKTRASKIATPRVKKCISKVAKPLWWNREKRKNIHEQYWFSDNLPKQHRQVLQEITRLTEDHKARNKKSTKKKEHRKVSDIHGFLSQKNIKGLLKATKYTRRDLYTLYVRFKALCALSPNPSGLSKETFKKGVARLAVEDDLFVDRVYGLIDEDQSDSIEWEEFLCALAALEKGNRKQKISFLIQIYDLDGDGQISKDDLGKMFLSSSMLKDDSMGCDLVEQFVKRTFKILTGDESGMIKISEQHIQNYFSNNDQDIWTFFGRSMLHSK